MFYNPLFEFSIILEDPRNTSLILELFDNAIGKEFVNKDIKDSDWFPIEDEIYYLDDEMHVPFLSFKYKTNIICYGVPCNEDVQRNALTTTYSWYHL